jgi:hypothetical protein
MNASNRSEFVYVTYIRTTPAKLWQAACVLEIPESAEL